MTADATDTIPDHVYERSTPDLTNGRAHRTPIHAPDLELDVAALVLNYPDLRSDLIDQGLAAQLLYRPALQTLVDVILTAHRDGTDVDHHTIRSLLPADYDTRLLAEVASRPVITARSQQWINELHRLHHERSFDDILARAKQARDDGIPADRVRVILDELGHSADSPAGDGLSSWVPVDLTRALEGEGPPAPEVWRHNRGHRLLYAGRTHAFVGAAETLKSWAAQGAAAEILSDGGDVLYIDYEDDQAGVSARLIALGVPKAAILEHLVYLRPDEPLMDRRSTYTRGGLDFHKLLASRPWRLSIIDGMTEAMTTEGLDVNDNADSARFQRRLMRPIAETGAATVAIDHQAKNAEPGSRFAIGAQHKLSGLTGAAYQFQSQRPLGRPAGLREVIGLTKITVSKDRPGYIRGKAPDGIAGILQVTSWPDLRVDVEVIDPADLGDAGADMELAGRILKHLDTYDGETKSQLETQLGGNQPAVRATRDWLISKGWVEVHKGEKRGTPHRLHLTDTGRQEVPE